MPLYEYDCSGCGKTLEIIQKFSDPVLTECPECKGAITKRMSRTSFHLKGTGWYASDYKKSSSPAPAPEASKDSSTPKESSGHKHGGGCASGACGSSGKGDTKS